MKKLISILLFICILTLCLTSCGKKSGITENMIISELSDSNGELDGTLTITEGTAENVLAFKYEVTEINAEYLMDKNYMKNTVQKLISNKDLTYGELKVCNAFVAVMQVLGIFYESETFNGDAYTDEIISIICDRNTKTYKNWRISASVDLTADSIIVTAIYN